MQAKLKNSIACLGNSYFNTPHNCPSAVGFLHHGNRKYYPVTGRFSEGLRRLELSYPASKTVVKAALRACRFPLHPSDPLPRAVVGRGQDGRSRFLFEPPVFHPAPRTCRPPSVQWQPTSRGTPRPTWLGAHLAHQPPACGGEHRGKLTPRLVDGARSLFCSSRPPGECWSWRGALFEILCRKPHTVIFFLF